MEGQTQYARSLWLCLLGIVFLFDPNIAFADYLPNAIGYFLLLWGISRAGELFDRLQDATHSLTKMLWISLGIFFGRAVLQSFMPESDQMNAFEGSTISLIIGFVLAVMQIYYLIPALKDLFLGLESVMERHATGNLLPEKKGKSAGERMAGFSSFFVFANSVLALLPELTVLSGASYAAGKAEYDWYRFIGLFRTVTGFFAAVIGVIWLIRAILFLLHLCRDRGLMQTLAERYTTEILPHRDMLLYRRACFAFTFFIIGSVFAINLRIDEKNLLPSVLSVMLCLFGIPWTWDLWKGFRKKTAAVLTYGGILLLSATVRELLTYLYFDKYTTTAQSLYNTGAFSMYLGVRIAAVIECVAVSVFFISLIDLMLATAQRQDQEHSSAAGKSNRPLVIRAYAAAISFAIAMVANAVEAFLHLNFPWLWWITLPLTAISVALFASFVFAVREYLENRALSESLRISSNSVE